MEKKLQKIYSIEWLFIINIYGIQMNKLIDA